MDNEKIKERFIASSTDYPLDLQPNKYIIWINIERRFRDNTPANIHERMQKVTEAFGRFFKGNYKGGTIKLFIGKIQEGNNTFPEVDLPGIFSIYVQGFGLPGKIKDNAVEYRAQVW